MKAKQKVLVIGSTWAGIYKDVLAGFDELGDFEVDFIEEIVSLRDPLNVRKEFALPKSLYDNKLFKCWNNTLSSSKYNKDYDILFVLDGQGIHEYVFYELKKRNPNLIAVNYIFDTIKGVYRFDQNFHFFDKVYTFDLEESKKYGARHLPIFWCKGPDCEEEYDFFGIGAYSSERFFFFKEINDFAEASGLKPYVKVFANIPYSETQYKIRQGVRKMLGLVEYIPLEWYHTPLVTHQMISTADFRRYISQSKIIVDTSPLHQDGLTARFMWALGEGKKIITTNRSVTNYDFYSPDFIFVIDSGAGVKSDESFREFVFSNYVEKESTREIIDKFRIDNWIREIINI